MATPCANGAGEKHCCQSLRQNFWQEFLQEFAKMVRLVGSCQHGSHRCQTHRDGDTSIPLNYTIVEHCKIGQLVSRDTHHSGATGNCVELYIRRLRDAAPMSADIAIMRSC